MDTQEAEIISSQRPIEEKVKELTELLKKRVDQELGTGDLSRAQEGIRNGKTLNKIKEFVKKSKAKGGWGEYTKKYLSTISERTIQNWMHAGKSPHFKRYAGMGLERLLKVDRLSKAHGGTDPITAFLKDAGIKPIPEGGRVSMETKKLIDAAIAKAHAILKIYHQPPKKSAMNLLADRLIEQLAESLKHDDTMAGVDLGKLEILEEKIKNVRAELGKK